MREVLDGNIRPGSVGEQPLNAAPSEKAIQRIGDSDLFLVSPPSVNWPALDDW